MSPYLILLLVLAAIVALGLVALFRGRGGRGL